MYSSQGVPLARRSALIPVYRVDENGEYQLLVNVACLGINYKEGADPGQARFRYLFDEVTGHPGAPTRFEEVYPLDADGPLVVKNDDHLVVDRLRDDGSAEVLFDGYAQIPQVDLDAETESVSFVALGTPIREWDTPLGGAACRHADVPAESGVDEDTDLPARFNPDGRPNASPGDPGTDDPDTPAVDESLRPLVGISDKDSGEGTHESPKYPVFLGPIWPANEIHGERIRMWDLGMAVRYILARGNPDQLYVRHGDMSNLDVNLQAITPKEEGGPIDLEDDTTFSLKPIMVPDYDVTGEPWPVALERLLEPHGFAFRFVLEEDLNRDPEWRISIYRKDDNVSVKALYLQEAGADLDPGQTNVGGLKLARDVNQVVNHFVVDSAPVMIEASFVLAPGFAHALTDVDNKEIYVEGNPQFTGANVDKFRLFIFDECGEGHWDFATAATVTVAGDLKSLMRWEDEDHPFVTRRRPGRNRLLSKDSEGKRFSAKLHVSSDYEGLQPGVWDGTGTWQEVVSGEWELLDDRLGIRVTAPDPNDWSIGKHSTGAPTAYKSGNKLSLVEWIATRATADALSTTAGNINSYPRFRVTCVIEADVGLRVEAKRRDVSPTGYSIVRRVDARDRFEKQIISKFSVVLREESGAGPDASDDIPVDDTPDAQSQADGLRRAHELGSFAGSVTIPRLTTAYRVGDKIDIIHGREVSLRSNAASETGETAIYPSVVAVSFELDGHQSVSLELSDARGEPAPERRESRED
jgi:hypothetical protein